MCDDLEHKSRIIGSTFEHIKNGALTVTLKGSSSPLPLLFSRFPVTEISPFSTQKAIV